MTQQTDLTSRMRAAAADVEFADAHDPSAAARLLREGAARLDHLEPHNAELEADCAALRKAYAEASGGRVGTVADMIAAIHRGAR